MVLWSVGDSLRNDLEEVTQLDSEAIEDLTGRALRYIEGEEQDGLNRNVVSVAQVLLEAAKRQIRVKDLSASLEEAGFMEESARLKLCTHYEQNVRRLRRHLAKCSVHQSHYVNVEWRLEVKLASRMLRNSPKPQFLIELETTADGKQFLQSDFACLKHVVSELENAVKETRTSHGRRVVKYIN